MSTDRRGSLASLIWRNSQTDVGNAKQSNMFLCPTASAIPSYSRRIGYPQTAAITHASSYACLSSTHTKSPKSYPIADPPPPNFCAPKICRRKRTDIRFFLLFYLEKITFVLTFGQLWLGLSSLLHALIQQNDWESFCAGCYSDCDYILDWKRPAVEFSSC